MSLFQLFILFIKVNLISFGGPSVGISILENELVEKKKILTQKQMDEIYVTTNIVPGPVYIQLSVLIGYELKKFWGVVVCLLASISLIPFIAIILYFYVSKLIPEDKLNEFTYLMSPIIMMILVNFSFKTLKKNFTKVHKFIFFTECLLALALLVFFKMSLFVTLMITLGVVFFVHQFMFKVMKVGDK